MSTVTLVSDSVMAARRLRWIEALESGEFEQGTGVLFAQDMDPVGDIDAAWEPVPDTQSYCCLGVGRKVPSPSWLEGCTGDESDDDSDYEWVESFYGIGRSLRYHLVAMNDGGSRHEGGCLVRMNGSRRDFAFIARFLRKVWGLSDA